MSQVDQNLVEEIGKAPDIETGVMTLCTSIAQAIRENVTNPRFLLDLAAALDLRKGALAQATAANLALPPDDPKGRKVGKGKEPGKTEGLTEGPKEA